MRPFRLFFRVRSFVLVVFLWNGLLSQAETPQRLKIKAEVIEDRLVAYSLKNRDASKDADRMRMEGQIQSLNLSTHEFSIGPQRFRWSEMSRFEGMHVSDLREGFSVELDAMIQTAGPYEILRLSRNKPLSLNQVELIGALQQKQQLEGSSLLTVAGLLIEVPATIYDNGRIRTRGLDDKRPNNQMTINVYGHPLTLGGEVELVGKTRQGYDLSGGRDRNKMEQQLKLELYYPLRRNVSVFLETQIQYETSYDLNDRTQDSDFDVKRGESWLYWNEILGSGVSLQLGRQNIAEEREWWWDADLDAIRVFYEAGPFLAEVALAQELTSVSYSEDRVDAAEDDVRRLLGHVSWRGLSYLELAGFFLFQRDNSGNDIGLQAVPEKRQDNSDADLNWYGLRAVGDFEALKVNDLEVSYWADIARVTGTEKRFAFDDQGISSSDGEFDLDGWGMDTGISIRFPGRFEPTVTLGWAQGSGDEKADDNKDSGFRQTSLQDNNDKFNGVDRFRYYGELLRPELSNLKIATAAFGIRFQRASSLEILYHDYTQMETSSTLPSLAIRSDYTGLSGEIGYEVDLVAGLEEWEHWEIEIVASYFNPGAALEGNDSATAFNLKLNYNF